MEPRKFKLFTGEESFLILVEAGESTNFLFEYKGIISPDILNNNEPFDVTVEKVCVHATNWYKEWGNFEGFLDYFDWVN
jgi:hypothetical protein